MRLQSQLWHVGRVVALAAIAVAGLAHAAAAQTSTGSIRGYLTDSSGAPLEVARVVAVSVLTSARRDVTTQAHGFYAILGLTPGEYDVTASQIGMAPQKIRVRVLIGEVFPLDFRLAASAIQVEAVTVVAATGVETRTSEVATNVTTQQIATLPLSDRNFLDLAQLAPGIVVQNSGLNNTTKTFSGNGLNAQYVNVFIDGTSFKNDLTQGGVAGQDASRGNPFPLNAVQEFRVLTDNYKAEYQKASSAIISAVTKSGGNRWEGSAFFYGQGKGLIGTDSIPCTTGPSGCVPAPKPDYSRYQAGASVGGPIIRDRLFFFGAYEGNYQNRAGTVVFNRDSAALANYPALDTVTLAKYQGQFPSPFRSTLGFAKLTYVPTPTQTLDVSMNLRHETDVRDFGGITSYLTANNYKDDVNSFVAKHRYTKSNVLNEATVSFQHFERNPSPTNPGVISRNYFDNVTAPCCTFIGQLGGSQSSQDYTQNRLSLRNDVTYAGWQWAGQHVVKIGANLDFAHYDLIKDNNTNPLFMYQASDSFAFPHQALLGIGNPHFTTTNHQIGAYVQDDWSPTQRLLLNIGIRWDYESDMLDNNFVTPAKVVAGFDTILPAKYFTNGTQRPPFYGAFQPRLGLSYALDQQGRTTLFAGFGIYYDRDLYDAVAIQEQYAIQHPNYNFFFFKNPADSGPGRVRWNNSYLTKQGLLGLLASGQTGAPEADLVANDTKPPYSEHWSVGIRRVLGSYLVSVTSAHVRSYHGFTFTCGNLKGATTGFPPNCFNPPVTGFGNVFTSSDAVRAWYDAVYVKVDRPYTAASRWGAGLTYTWSKATQIGGDAFSFDYPTVDAYPHYPSPNDQRNTVVGNWMVDLPLDFQFSGLLTLGSGQPFQIGGPETRTYPTKQSFIFSAWAFRDLDVRFRKHLATFGTQGTDLTAEVFNVFNYQNLGCWGGGSLDPTKDSPGCIAYGSRRLQLGAGYNF